MTQWEMSLYGGSIQTSREASAVKIKRKSFGIIQRKFPTEKGEVIDWEVQDDPCLIEYLEGWVKSGKLSKYKKG